MSRSADLTRQDLLEAATAVFAARGFEGGSVRDISRAAKANVAAVSYHFGGKDGLYRAVLERSAAAFEIPSFDSETLAALDRAEMVRRFLRAQVATLLRHGELSRHLRIFAWENLSRTRVFDEFVATARFPVMEIAGEIVRRYMPDADAETRTTTIVWLLHQAEPFTRNPERLTRPPLRLSVDAGFVERLTERLHTLATAGLDALARANAREAAPVVT